LIRNKEKSEQYKTDRLRSLREKLEMGERKVGVAMDMSACSRGALKWAVESLLREGDCLVIINVQGNVTYEEGHSQLWEDTGSPFIPLIEYEDPSTTKRYGVKADPKTLEILKYAAKEKKVIVVAKIYWGDPREKLCDAVGKLPLNCLVVGNRGLGKIKRAILGSVSNYVVNNASCPVTVVKSSEPEN
jgi:nucleotide-binding universal stress UspA family protein